jgi:DNA-binding XRE family transcriptional regulator
VTLRATSKGNGRSRGGRKSSLPASAGSAGARIQGDALKAVGGSSLTFAAAAKMKGRNNMKKQHSKQSQTLADRLALVRRRKAAGLSQGGVARLAQVSTTTICHFEKGIEIRPALEKSVREAFSRIMDASEIINPERKGAMDKEWLRRQTDSFLRSNCLGVVEQDNKVHFVLSFERAYEFGRALLLAAGKNVDC